jgi:DNA-binding CsgD family transcriptional regulator
MNLTVAINLNGRQIHAATVPLESNVVSPSWLASLDFDLTEREIEVVKLIATGMQYKQVAKRLGITERTVRTHLTHIFQAMDISNNTMLVSYAWLTGMVTEQDVIQAWRDIAPHLVQLT